MVDYETWKKTESIIFEHLNVVPPSAVVSPEDMNTWANLVKKTKDIKYFNAKKTKPLHLINRVHVTELCVVSKIYEKLATIPLKNKKKTKGEPPITKSQTELLSSLHSKIEGKKKLNDENAAAKKRERRTKSKAENAKKKSKAKKSSRENMKPSKDIGNNKNSVVAGKPANNDFKFSRFEFEGEEDSAPKVTKKKLIHALNEAKEKTESGNVLNEWKAAMQKASGSKLIAAEPEQLKKVLKASEKRRKKSSKKWSARKQMLAKRVKEKQQKRQKNLNERAVKRLEKKRKRLVKKGRILTK